MIPGITTSLVKPDLPQIEYFVLAGGGGGGGGISGSVGGGGGAGGLVIGGPSNMPAGNYTVSVGIGGVGVGPNNTGGNGAASTISSWANADGGGGGGGGTGAGSAFPGSNGGCGGGGGGSPTAPGAGGSATQNWNGAAAVLATGGGGGGTGGSPLAGSLTTGGAGTTSTFSGYSVVWGRGGDGFGAGIGVQPAPRPDAVGEGGIGGYNAASGYGGSGVAMLRYQDAQKATGGQVYTSGGYTIHYFRNYQYAQTFTLRSSPVTAQTETKLLMHFDGTNGSTVSGDSSSAAHGNALFTGNAQLSTAQKKFGTASLLLDGTGDLIQYSPAHADWDFGTGNFTVDWWEYRTVNKADGCIVSTYPSPNIPSMLLGYLTASTIYCFMSTDGVNWNIAQGKVMGTLELNVWHHFAVVRNGTFFYTFMDGVQQDTWYSALPLKSPPAGGDLLIGYWYNGTSFYYQGYIDELRIVKGVAAWTSNFTPPAAPYT